MEVDVKHHHSKQDSATAPAPAQQSGVAAPAASAPAEAVQEAEARESATRGTAAHGTAAPAVLPRFRTASWATALSSLFSDVVAIGSIVSIAWIVADHFALTDAPITPGALYALAPLLCLAYALSGLYHANAMHPARELRRTSITTAVVGLSCTVSAVLAGASTSMVMLIALLGGLASVVVPSCRVFFRVLLAQASWWGVPAVVVGSGKTGSAVIRALRRWPELGLKPVALLQDDRADGDWAEDDRAAGSVPRMGSIDRAPELAQAHGIPCAIVAMPDLSRYEAATMLEHYGKFFKQIFVVPGMSSAHHLWTTANTYEGLSGYGVQHYTWYKGARFVKRAIDLAGALLGLLLTLPLLLVVPLLIKLGSSGPVFFKQERMGREGRCFSVYKFRTMYQDAEAKLQEILQQDPERRREYQQYHKLQDDPRVTPVGKWLRRYSLDELPQLFNVLRGDMSLVGPRAYLPAELPNMNGMARTVLQSPPGITGLWQVSGRNRLSFEERVDLDVHYMQNWTPWLDFYILARTIPVVLTGSGAS